MSAIVSVFGQFVLWIGGYFAARWGIKIALVAAILSTYAAIWAAFLVGLAACAALLPAHGFTPFLLQFFPSQSAIATATAAYYGSMMARRSIDFWSLTFGLVAKVGS